MTRTLTQQVFDSKYEDKKHQLEFFIKLTIMSYTQNKQFLAISHYDINLPVLIL